MTLRAWASPAALVALSFALAAGCYAQPPPEPLSCEEKPDVHCGHPIDHVLVPKLRAAGFGPRDGDGFAVCRRLYIDLIGRIPTPAELDACRLQSLEQRVDAVLARPEYALIQQRAWAEVLGFDTNIVWYGYLVDLDRLVGRLARGEITYPAFASEVAIHPGFYALHQGDDWPAKMIDIFLGRSARMDEVAGMRPLARIFELRVFCDAALWGDAYAEANEDGITGAAATTAANESCVSSGSEEYAYNPCGCLPGFGFPGCRSDVLGAVVDFGGDACPNEEAPPLYRWNDQAPGLRAHCPDASRPECQDRLVDDNEQVAGPITGYPLLASPLKERVLALGAALTARGDFWEAAVDRELRRYIGWWKDGVRRPDFDLPEVRTILAAELRRTGDLRVVQKLILTSLLYAGASEPPPGVTTAAELDRLPLYAMGSTKMLSGENWIDSAATATAGAPLGFCDYRFVGVGAVGPTNVALSEIRHVPSALGETAFPEQRYLAEVQRLGGCTAAIERPRVSSVGMTYAEHDLAQSMCALAKDVVPPGIVDADSSDATLGAIADHLARRLLSRDLADDERAEALADMRECIAAGAAGCTSSSVAARWLCARIIDSAEFALY